MDGGVWWTAVHGVAKGRIRLSDFTFTFPFHALENLVFLPGESQGQGSQWFAVYGVAQSWTRLKRLSSSSRRPMPLGQQGNPHLSNEHLTKCQGDPK